MEMSLSDTRILKSLIMAMLFVLSQAEAFPQSHKPNARKAANYFYKAREQFQVDNDKALKNVDKALRYDDRFADALLLKAELSVELGDDGMAMDSYERLLEVDSFAFPKSAISLSKLYAEYHQFDKSINLLSWYLSLDDQKETSVRYAERQLMLMLFRKTLVENPVDFNPENIGDIVNTAADEYVNQIRNGDSRLVFTKRYGSDSRAYPEENVFVTDMCDSLWSMPRLVFEDVRDIGALNVSSNGDEVYFSGCGWDGGLGSCDIYLMRYTDGSWGEPVNIASVNTREWESQPCVSRDGKDLYFVRRDRKSGTSDIYVSRRDENGSWQKAEALCPNVNTEGNEMAPFIHHDGVTLYFSSDTHLGMGGYDLFMSRRGQDGEWSEPVNLGYPLNTDGDEINFVVSENAAVAYISAIRDEGHGAYDIYAFELDERFRPEPLVHDTISAYESVLYNDEPVVLSDVYFEFDSAELSDGSYEAVDALADFLLSHEEVNVELVGHTDDMGDDDYNIVLSERRAKSIRKALIDRGVDAKRVSAYGRGAECPLFPNDTDRHRALNRRVEMRCRE